MLVKVCGMRQAQNIGEVEALGIDLMGFIFYERSPRYVADMPAYLPACKRVGVFVNADANTIASKAAQYALDMVQLHGNENPQFCHELKAMLPAATIIKAIPISTSLDFNNASQYSQCADMLLFETRNDGYGGSGKKFDWHLLDKYQGNLPFLLSGGIGPDDIDAIAHIKHPKMAGVDLNSRFELSPAVKNIQTLKTFIDKTRKI